MQVKILIMMILLFFLCSSCIFSGKEEIKPTPPTPVKTDLAVESANIAKSKNSIAEEASSIKTQASSIKSDTESGKKQAPGIPQWDSISKSADAIDSSGNNLIEESKKLGTIEVNVSTAKSEVDALNELSKSYNANVKQLQEEMKKQQKEIASYKDGVKKRQQMIWMGVSGICAIGLLLGIFLAVYANPKLGTSLAISCAIMACVSYFMAAYALLVAIVGGIFLLGLVTYSVHYLYINKKALEETVKSFEKVKENGIKDPEIEKSVNDLQSLQTKQIIHDIRLKEGLK